MGQTSGTSDYAPQIRYFTPYRDFVPNNLYSSHLFFYSDKLRDIRCRNQNNRE